MTPRSLLVGNILLLVATPVAVSAQEHRGLWGRFVGGGGWTNVSTDQSGVEQFEPGGVGAFSGGWTLRDQILVGAEFDLWTKTLNAEAVEVSANVYNLLGTLTWYPRSTFGWFVKGGAGVAFRDADLARDDTTVELGKGLALTAGAGVDFAVARAVSWTVGVDLWYARAEVSRQIDIFPSQNQRVLAVTFGLTFH